MIKLSDLESQIGINFNNKKLLENVFVHRSYLNEQKNFYLPSNEKLEFLGDSVLSLISSLYLYQNYPQLHEGEYTDVKSAIVKTESLSQAAKNLNLGKYLYLSKGEELNNGRENSSILADCFEALIGAIFLDQGFKEAYNFVVKFLFQKKIDVIVKNRLFLSAKNLLQEYTQNKYKKLPKYLIVKESGPDHNKIYTVAVYVNNKKVGQGMGKSKKQAEEKAAFDALQKMRVSV